MDHQTPVPAVGPRSRGETVLLVGDDSTMRATLGRVQQDLAREVGE